LLLPGTLCDERVWRPLLAALGDPPAMARLLVGAASTPAMAAKLLEELPERFAVAGFSLGGIVALEMIARAPERIAGLALIDTTARPDPAANHPVRRNAVARAAQIGLHRYATHKLWALYAGEDQAADLAHRDLVVDMAVRLGLDTFRSQSEIAIARVDSRPRLGAIAVPTLVLCGEHDRLCPVAVHREMAEGIPGARLAVIERAGHFALIERPDRVAIEVRRWLDAIHAGSAGRDP
jgi:pimeloyl-ACP methyl ester carboxylesterase